MYKLFLYIVVVIYIYICILLQLPFNQGLWEPYVELHYSSILSYLAFLSEDLRYRRKELNLTWKDKGLVMMDRAAVHSCATFKQCRDLWQKQNNCLLVCGDSGDDGSLPIIPGGWGACGAPNDGWHQFFHGLRRSYPSIREVVHFFARVWQTWT